MAQNPQRGLSADDMQEAVNRGDTRVFVQTSHGYFPVDEIVPPAAKHNSMVLYGALALAALALILALFLPKGMDQVQLARAVADHAVVVQASKDATAALSKAEEAKKSAETTSITSTTAANALADLTKNPHLAKVMSGTCSIRCDSDKKPKVVYKTRTVVKYVDRPVPRPYTASATASASASAGGAAAAAASASSSASTDVPVGARTWLWYHFLSTPTNRHQCIIAVDTRGAGLPPYCNGYKVLAPRSGENKHMWLSRAGEVGGVPGRPEDKGLYNAGLQK